MKTNWIKTAGVFLLTTVIVAGIDAQPRQQGGRGYGGNGEGSGRMHQHASLDLTETQQEQMTTLRTNHYKVIKPLKNKMVELKARENTLLSEESVDMKAVNKNIDSQTDLMNKMRKLQVEQRLETKSILTDEQVMKLEQRKNFSKQRRGSGNNSHMGRNTGQPYHRNRI